MLERNYNIDFSEENKERFNCILTEMHDVLLDFGFSIHSNWITQILSSVIKEDSLEFQNRVLSFQFLGGAGSICDIQIRDNEKNERFDSLLNSFLKLAYQSGLRSRDIKSRIAQ